MVGGAVVLAALCNLWIEVPVVCIGLRKQAPFWKNLLAGVAANLVSYPLLLGVMSILERLIYGGKAV